MSNYFDYAASYLNKSKADKLLEHILLTTPFYYGKIHIFAKEVQEPRSKFLMGDAGLSYTYSNKIHKCNPWDNKVFQIKEQIEKDIQHKFNTCLINKYKDGNEYMGWHRDNEKELGSNIIIASLSLGAKRDFQIRSLIDKDKQNFELQHGDLFIMKSGFQNKFEHQLPKRKRIMNPRLNLTFRLVL